MKLSDITTEQKSNILSVFIHAMIYGRPKTGKTELVGELAEHGFHLYWFDLENGIKTLINSVSPSAQENITVYRIPDTPDVPMAVETCLKVMTPGKFLICQAHGKIGTVAPAYKCPLCAKTPGAIFNEFDNTTLGPKDIVVFDSMTQFSDSTLNSIMRGKDIEFKPGWDEYNHEGRILSTFLGKVQNAPFHIIVISHEQEVKIQDKQSLVPVAGTRNFSRNSAKYFDEVVYTAIRNKKHEAASSTMYDVGITTGSRSRTKLEDQKDMDLKTRDAHISLLPIFTAQGITGNTKALEVLQQLKEATK